MPKMRLYVKQDCTQCQRMSDVPVEDIEWLKEHGLIFGINCTKCTKPFELTVEDAQWLRERNVELVSTCRDCGDSFSIYSDEIIWLLENDLKLFRRCSDCRRKNKELNKDQKEYEVMTDEEAEETVVTETVTSDGD